jgi:hypothetical protein
MFFDLLEAMGFESEEKSTFQWSLRCYSLHDILSVSQKILKCPYYSMFRNKIKMDKSKLISI